MVVIDETPVEPASMKMDPKEDLNDMEIDAPVKCNIAQGVPERVCCQRAVYTDGKVK